MTATATSVRVDRQALVELLVEIDAVENVLSQFAGCYPAAVAERLAKLAVDAAVSAFGPVEYDEQEEWVGVHGEILEAGDARAARLLAEMIGGAS